MGVEVRMKIVPIKVVRIKVVKIRTLIRSERMKKKRRGFNFTYWAQEGQDTVWVVFEPFITSSKRKKEKILIWM